MHKFLLRVRRAIYANYRDIESRRKYLNNNETSFKEEIESEINAIKYSLHQKQEFMAWLFSFLVGDFIYKFSNYYLYSKNM